MRGREARGKGEGILLLFWLLLLLEELEGGT